MSAKNSEKKSRSQSRQISNTNYNFSETRGTDPSLMKRSRFARNSTLATGFQVGDIVPIYVEEILPNDTVDMNCNFALRLQTLAVVPYDNLEFDIYWFYCPNRLLWDGWKAFCGETASAWLDKTPVRVPELNMPGFEKKEDGLNTIWDYMGLPIVTKTQLSGLANVRINSLPFRMYGKVFNDWFRDVNYDEEVLVDYGNGDVTYDPDDPVKGGKPLKANKKHDYFTSVLPQPQRSEDINLLDGLRGLVLNVTTTQTGEFKAIPNGPIEWQRANNGTIGTPGTGKRLAVSISNEPGNPMNGKIAEGPWAINTTEELSGGVELLPTNLVVDLNGNATNANPGFINSFTIANLRKSIAKQQIAEVSARCGNRYQNFLLGFFGVDGPDIETGRSELLGIQHTTIRIAEVVQTSGSVEGSTPQGNIAGRSLTNIEKPHAFTKSFLEHGWIMALGVARYNHSYSQGIRRQWTRRILDDYYMPQMANIGDVPVYKYELYANGNTLQAMNDAFGNNYPIWGYQEYGAEYKYVPNQITGAIRPDIEGGLSPWTWADMYATEPTMSADWLKEDPNNVSRSLSIEPTAKVPQIFGNFFFGNNHTRMMPVHSIPGLERV